MEALEGVEACIGKEMHFAPCACAPAQRASQFCAQFSGTGDSSPSRRICVVEGTVRCQRAGGAVAGFSSNLPLLVGFPSPKNALNIPSTATFFSKLGNNSSQMSSFAFGSGAWV